MSRKRKGLAPARRCAGFADKFLAVYSRGMTVREIQAFLAEMYAVEVSPDPITRVTDGRLALRSITARWAGKAANHWPLAMQQFAFLHDGPRHGRTPRTQNF